MRKIMIYQNYKKHSFYSVFAVILAIVLMATPDTIVKSQRATETGPSLFQFNGFAFEGLPAPKKDIQNMPAGPTTPGSLDPTFGTGGNLAVKSGRSAGAAAVAIQADGRIVAAGRAGFCVNTENCSYDFALARYNADGSLDRSFDGDGRVTINFGGWNTATTVVIQPDGKIVVAGTGALFRYNTSGSLDASFGVGGRVNANLGIAQIALQTDGKIVAAGGNVDSFVIARYNGNGSLDTSFGTGGIVMANFNEFSGASSVALQADGKIIAAGSTGFCDDKNQACFSDFALARFNVNGAPDTSFDGDGVVIYTEWHIDGYSSVVVRSDGKILAAGGDGFGFVVDRYNGDGSWDPSFDFDDFADGGASSVVLQSDGKIVASGSAIIGLGWDFKLVRLNTDGSFDTSFDGDGIVTTDFGSGLDVLANVAIQADGKIVAAGRSGYPESDFALSRYNTDGSLDASFDGDGKVTTSFRDRLAPFDYDGDGRADVSVFRPSDRVWYLNQSTNGFSATQFGLPTDKITPADYDGDGKTDISVYRDGTWYWLKSSNGSFNAAQFGLAGDIPVPADFTGDGRDELAVYRNGQWWALDLSNNQSSLVNFGLATDKPLAADYDGDGRADQAVYRDGVWHLNRSSQGYTAIQFGLSSDLPVVGDYDADGLADAAVYRGGTWYLLRSTEGFAAFQWGISTDIPAPADYDGDGRADLAIYRNGTWWISTSGGGIVVQQFGLANDKPVPSAYMP
jgi:uncharacterized delta-60 repeat protein